MYICISIHTHKCRYILNIFTYECHPQTCAPPTLSNQLSTTCWRHHVGDTMLRGAKRRYRNVAHVVEYVVESAVGVL